MAKDKFFVGNLEQGSVVNESGLVAYRFGRPAVQDPEFERKMVKGPELYDWVMSIGDKWLTREQIEARSEISRYIINNERVKYFVFVNNQPAVNPNVFQYSNNEFDSFRSAVEYIKRYLGSVCPDMVHQVNWDGNRTSFTSHSGELSYVEIIKE